MKKHGVPVRFTGQHFTIDPLLIQKSIRLADIQNNDLVLDIGAGRGFLTVHLVGCSGHVIAIEKDPLLVEELRSKFAFNNNLTIVASDFRRFRVPRKRFKVVSNIPYGITSCILRSLMYHNAEYFTKGSLIMQLQAARKLLQTTYFNPYGVCYHTFFDLELISVVPPCSFFPPPAVQSALVRISSKRSPSIGIEMKEQYLDFLFFMLKYPDLPLFTVLKKIFRKSQGRALIEKYGLNPDDKVPYLSPEQFAGCFSEMLQVVPGKFHPQKRFQ